MPVKMSYAIGTTNKSRPRIVDGYKIDLNFACHKAKQGWEITHVPTGKLLTQIRFSSFDDCEMFVAVMKSVEGELWFSTDVNKIHTQMPVRLVKVIRLLNRLALTEPILKGDKMCEVERMLYA